MTKKKSNIKIYTKFRARFSDDFPEHQKTSAKLVEFMQYADDPEYLPICLKAVTAYLMGHVLKDMSSEQAAQLGAMFDPQKILGVDPKD